jgi:hypothetical protein
VTGVRIPGLDTLPEGPQRSLAVALYKLYERAGKPSTRRIAQQIREDDQLPGTLSHEAVSSALRGRTSSP